MTLKVKRSHKTPQKTAEKLERHQPLPTAEQSEETLSLDWIVLKLIVIRKKEK